MNIQKLLSLRGASVSLVQKCGIKNVKPPPTFHHIEMPERTKLRYIDKVPAMPTNMKPPKMQKRLRYMRGPELVHNTLLHKQYGIIALGGGRMKWVHYEVLRVGLVRKLDFSKVFAEWRIDAPWQPVTKRGQGQRLGGGKGAIDHYVTPIKTGRVILEVGGKCEYKEVEKCLTDLANKLPFKAAAVSQEILDKMAEDEKWELENNQNEYTMKYLIQNNMGGCHVWLSPHDLIHYCKYV